MSEKMAIIGVAVAAWALLAAYTYWQYMRMSFWKWPSIWKPNELADRVMGIPLALSAPVGLLVMCATEWRLYWPAIPEEAFERAKTWTPVKKPSREDEAMAVIRRRTW